MIINSRIKKIIFSTIFFLLSGSIIYCISNETDFQRFPNIFISYIEMVINNRIGTDNLSFFPLYNDYLTNSSSFSLTAQSIITTESYYPNIVIFYLNMYFITGIEPQLLIIIPFGALIIPIIYLAMLKSISKNILNNWAIFPFSIIMLYSIVYIFTTKSIDSFYAATPGYALFFCIVICLIKYYTLTNNKYYYIILFLLLIGLAHYWHSALMMASFFIAGIILCNIFLFILHKLLKHNLEEPNNIIKTRSLTILTFVVTAAFIHLWQSSFLREFVEDVSIKQLIREMYIKIIGGVPFYVPYQYDYRSNLSGNIYYISHMIIYFIPILIFIITLWLVIRNYKSIIIIKNGDLSLCLFLGIFIAQIIFTIGYYLSDAITFIYVPILFFPVSILMLSFIPNYRIPKKIIIFTTILAVTILLTSMICLVSLVASNHAGENSEIKYNDTEASFLWSYSKINREQSIYLDFNLLGKYLQRESEIQQPIIKYYYINSTIYSYILVDQSEYHYDGYVIMDLASINNGLPIHIMDARATLKPEPEQLMVSTNSNLIYSDSNIGIFQLR